MGAPRSRNAAPGAWSRRRLEAELPERYFPILYVRSPAAFLDDSIFSPPLLPRMLTKPRTVCGSHPVAFTISASVAPLARFIIAMTSAFLLVRSAFGLLAGFLAACAFFEDFAFLALRAPLDLAVSGAGLLMLSLSIAFSLIGFSLTGLRSSHGSLRFGETSREICGRLRLSGECRLGIRRFGGCSPFFNGATKSGRG